MSLQFVRARPLQACKLGAIVAVLLFAVFGMVGVVPDRGLTSFVVVILLAIGLAFVVVAETLVTGYRSLRTGGPLTDGFADQPLNSIARAVEIVAVVLSAGAFAYLVETLPDEPPPGPGAIGLLFIVTGIGLVILAGGLVRTVTEYYDYRRNQGT